MVFSIAYKCQPCFPTEDRRKNLMVRVELRSAWMGGGMERSYAMEFVALWNECCSLATLFCFVEIDCSSFRTSYLLKNRRMLLPGLSREQNGVVPSCVFVTLEKRRKLWNPFVNLHLLEVGSYMKGGVILCVINFVRIILLIEL